MRYARINPVVLLLGLAATMARAEPVDFDAVLAQPVPPPALELQWGRHPAQRAELYLPAKGQDKPPVILLVHGGCWLSDFDMGYMRPLAQALSEDGWLVWSLSHRRLGHGVNPAREGLDDLLAAVERVMARLPSGVSSQRPWLLGHSAGGHMALLAAAELGPERVAGVVGLAAITDLHAYAAGDGSCNQAAARLQDGRNDDALSPIRRLPLGLPQLLIQGGEDPIVPVDQARAFVAAADGAGDRARLLLYDTAGHFEAVMAGNPATRDWRQALWALARATRAPRTPASM